MQLNISLDPANQTEVQSAAALIALFGAPAPEPAPAKAAAKSKPKAEPEDDDDEPEEPAPKANKGKAPAKAAAKSKPKAEPEDDDEEPEADAKALRMEIRGRFAAYAEEVGPLEGKALLDEFDAKKFSDIPDGKLAAFSKRLARLEAEM